MNETIFRIINDFGKDYSSLDFVYVFIAKYTVFILLLFLLFYWFSRRRENRIMVVSGGMAFVLGEIAARLAGLLHQNNQPFAELEGVNQLIDHAIDNSFPSDHTLMFFSISFTFLFFRKKGRLLWVLLAVLVALSRVIVGVHYPLDVFVGALIGIVTAYLMFKLIPRTNAVIGLLDGYDRIEASIMNKLKKNN